MSCGEVLMIRTSARSITLAMRLWRSHINASSSARKSPMVGALRAAKSKLRENVNRAENLAVSPCAILYRTR